MSKIIISICLAVAVALAVEITPWLGLATGIVMLILLFQDIRFEHEGS